MFENISADVTEKTQLVVLPRANEHKVSKFSMSTRQTKGKWKILTCK